MRKESGVESRESGVGSFNPKTIGRELGAMSKGLSKGVLCTFGVENNCKLQSRELSGINYKLTHGSTCTFPHTS